MSVRLLIVETNDCDASFLELAEGVCGLLKTNLKCDASFLFDDGTPRSLLRWAALASLDDAEYTSCNCPSMTLTSDGYAMKLTVSPRAAPAIQRYRMGKVPFTIANGNLRRAIEE